MESTTTPKTRRPLQVKPSLSPAEVVASTAPAAPASPRFELLDEAFRIESISHLCQWIERARFVLNEINLTRQVDPELNAALGKWKDIPMHSAEWTLEVSDALAMLQMDVALTMQAVCKKAEGK